MVQSVSVYFSEQQPYVSMPAVSRNFDDLLTSYSIITSNLVDEPLVKCRRSIRRLIPSSRLRILHVLIKPIDSFRQDVQQRFATRISMRFEGQSYVTHGCSLPFERHVKPL